MKTQLRDVRDGVALVEFPEAGDDAANRAAVLLGNRLRASGDLLDAIPGARTLCLLFDPAKVSRGRLKRRIGSAGRLDEGEGFERRVFRIPVVYDGEDLPDLARAAILSPGEFARRHAAPEYRVAFIGFAPGFPYLTGLPAELHAPRLPNPRPRVPAGSVAIGGPYTGVYPASTPGGWRLIGRAAVRLFDPEADRPALLAPGDRVVFEPAGAGGISPPPAPHWPPRGAAGGAVLRVLSPGLFTTIQGGPRYGLGSSGVPAGGAMDRESLARANALVGNAPDTPALEITLAGPELEALDRCVVALAGADLDFSWNEAPASSGEACALAPGDRLRIGRARNGVRAYLAVQGGLAGPRLTRRLEAGEDLTHGGRPAGAASRVELLAFSPEWRLRVIPGPQLDHFPEPAIDRFLESAWRVSPTSDRRGLRLEGPALEHARAAEIAPEGTVTGSVQVPGNGLPLVLGPDGPVTGGYPKIATVIAADLPLLGQAGPGTILRFAAVSLAEALAARRAAPSLLPDTLFREYD